MGSLRVAVLVFLRVNHGKGGRIDYVLHVAVALQDVNRFTGSHKDRPDRLCASQPRHELVGDVPGFKRRENQYVGPLLKHVEFIDAVQNLADNSRIGLHLPIYHDVGTALP